jgi:putative DNA primase/helicase
MTAPTFYPDQVPPELLPYPNFVAWRYEERDGKATKVPVNAHNGRHALTTSPSTWATFEEALPFARSNGYGLGFVFGKDDPFAGVDLDACIDPETNVIALWAWEIIAALDSYTEVSPSGRGLHTFIRATLPPTGRRKGAIEMYDRARFFTLTGHRLPDVSPYTEERQGPLDTLHAMLFPPAVAKGEKSGPTPIQQLDDAELLHKAMGAANGVKFSRLWLGDRSGYTSDSEADAAFLSMLSFWIGPDEPRLDAIFRRSGLMRDKWERASYRTKTFALIGQRTDYYDPSRRQSRRDGIPLFVARESA